jgi:hypothetical protein
MLVDKFYKLIQWLIQLTECPERNSQWFSDEQSVDFALESTKQRAVHNSG